MKKYNSLVVVMLLIIVFTIITGQCFAAEQGTEYLKYQEPQAGSSSLLLTVGYLIFLIIVFLLVLGLAYFTSRLIGQKMGVMNMAGDNKILTHLPFGSNRAVYVVEIAGRILVLGVTDHNINLLQEITSPDEIEKIKNQPNNPINSQFNAVFQKQLVVLHKMSEKFPGVFGSNRQGEDSSSVDKEKR
ncbi:MAG: Flagellar biosynthesis protein, FliO [Firmicutes bacterium]|nr:Flagellar biosynthesis protein, FliO [Bacillota bacterium]